MATNIISKENHTQYPTKGDCVLHLLLTIRHQLSIHNIVTQQTMQYPSRHCAFLTYDWTGQSTSHALISVAHNQQIFLVKQSENAKCNIELQT